MEEAVRPIFDWTDVSEYFPPVSKNEQETLLAQVGDLVCNYKQYHVFAGHQQAAR